MIGMFWPIWAMVMTGMVCCILGRLFHWSPDSDSKNISGDVLPQMDKVQDKDTDVSVCDVEKSVTDNTLVTTEVLAGDANVAFDSEKDADDLFDEGEKYLAELHAINSGIQDKELTAQISHMEELVSKVLTVSKKYKNQRSSVRKVLHVYLPMVFDLLHTYQDVDGLTVVSSNMAEIKKSVKDTIMVVNDAFERLLDSMYQDVKWDVSSNGQVLSTLLQQDGLGRPDFDMLSKDCLSNHEAVSVGVV